MRPSADGALDAAHNPKRCRAMLVIAVQSQIKCHYLRSEVIGRRAGGKQRARLYALCSFGGASDEEAKRATDNSFGMACSFGNLCTKGVSGDEAKDNMADADLHFTNRSI